ncbi:hypothetical protein JAO73_02590 [Hymenobacter sp. BT523]|uniref:hypothetical protein n=1 Tax=Hymenobacter sp. BT523 TaxID=2795725 RepID=UPI0018EC5B2F|nr:hypothetical protein [Hymenobacter sp. BT523]MBJ6107883.1 hypothetical protein [Hymenobacter sp. BT523]
MRYFTSSLASLLWLAASVASGQTVAPAATAPAAPEAPADDAARPVLVKVGLNVARSFRWGGYNGIPFRVPVTVGVEYRLHSKFTLYGQLDADFATSRYGGYADQRTPLLPTGALSLGGRYYYNQAGRARSNRAHGAFVGNYLAAEAHTEMWHHFESPGLAIPAGDIELRRSYVPTLNLLWGMQRRLGRRFLFDGSAGIGVGATRSDLNFGGFSSGPVNLSGQLNLGVYFGR